MRVLVLGGTGEARVLANRLVERGADVVTSLAGRVAHPAVPSGDVRVGGFGGVDELARYVRECGFDRVVVATHPFAASIARSGIDAANRAGTPVLVLRRPGWTAQPGDRWTWAADLPAAAVRVRARPDDDVVFLTVGRQGASAFAADGHRFVLRSVEPAQALVPARTHVVVGRGPFEVADELRLMREHAVTLLVTRDSGGEMTAAKLTAARRLGIEVLVVARPPLPDADVVAGVEGALAWCLP